MAIIIKSGNSVNEANVDANGNLQVLNTPIAKATYRATAFSSSSNAGVIFSVFGSASKIIKVIRIRYSSSLTTAAFGGVQVQKYTAALTGGTSASVTPASADSGDAASTAVVKTWSVAPTEPAGASTSTYDVVRYFAGDATHSGEIADLHFGSTGGKALVLNNASEGMSIFVGAALVGAGVGINIMVEWTEE